jgi:hypothetical protein
MNSRTALSLETLITVTPGLHERRVGDKVFLLDSQSVMHALDNDVAVTIWDVINGAPAKELTVASVVEAILSAFEVPHDRAQQDVLEFVCLLHARGIVETSA